MAREVIRPRQPAPRRECAAGIFIWRDRVDDHASSDTVHAEPRSIPRLEPNGKAGSEDAQAGRETAVGHPQAGGGPLAGNVGPPDDPDKWWPRKRRYEADPTPARRSLHRRRVSEMARGRRASDGGGRSPRRRDWRMASGWHGETEGSPTRHRCPDGGAGHDGQGIKSSWVGQAGMALVNWAPSTALQPSEPDPDPLPTAGA